MRVKRIYRSVLLAVSLAAFTALSIATTVLAGSGGGDWPALR
jgi:hypothetical protein